MRVVGLISSYRESLLTRLAFSSVVACEPDHVYIFEGPAGAPVSAECPESWLPEGGPRVTVEHGFWQTDAHKRTQIVKAAQADHDRTHKGEPLWGVWVDGDEVLINGAFLRDILQALVWRDVPEEPPTVGWPIRLVELDGSVAIVRAKVLRIDQISNYVVSSSGIKFKNGVVQAEGNLPMTSAEWWVAERMQLLEQGRYLLSPPLPGEPHLLHRSAFRHPARASVRMHAQELAELEKLGVKITR